MRTAHAPDIAGPPDAFVEVGINRGPFEEKGPPRVDHATPSRRHDYVLVELTNDPCPLFAYRATCGTFQAIGPTEAAAVETLTRAMGGAK